METNWNETKDQLWVQLWNHVEWQVKDNVWVQIGDQLWNQIGWQVCGQLWNQILDRVRDEMEDNYGN